MSTQAKTLVRHLKDGDPHTVGRALPGLEHDSRDEGQGTIVKLISRDLSGSEDMHLCVCHISPGQHHIRHYHPHGSEWYLVMSGEPTVFMGDEDIAATPGTIFYIPPGMVHGLRNDTGEDAELLVGLSKPDYKELGRVYVEE